jgi:hypothetical protein
LAAAEVEIAPKLEERRRTPFNPSPNLAPKNMNSMSDKTPKLSSEQKAAVLGDKRSDSRHSSQSHGESDPIPKLVNLCVQFRKFARADLAAAATAGHQDDFHNRLGKSNAFQTAHTELARLLRDILDAETFRQMIDSADRDPIE